MDEMNRKLIYLKEYVEKNPQTISFLNEEDKKLLINYYEELIKIKKEENHRLKNKKR